MAYVHELELYRLDKDIVLDSISLDSIVKHQRDYTDS